MVDFGWDLTSLPRLFVYLDHAGLMDSKVVKVNINSRDNNWNIGNELLVLGLAKTMTGT